MVALVASTAIAEKPTKTQIAELQKLSKAGHVTHAELEAFLGQNQPTDKTDYKFTLRCDFKKAVKAGKYNTFYQGVTDRKPPPADCQEGTRVQCHLFHFDRHLTTKEVIAEMNKEEYRPATWPELLALVADYPRLGQSSDISIVALGSNWVDDPDGYEVLGFAVNNASISKRAIGLSWLPHHFRWPTLTQFIAVHK